jgi:hypothetical protein
MPLGPALLGPARPGGGPDPERPELIEREHPVRETLQHLLDPVRLGVALRVGRLLPRLGPLERDAAAGEQAP